MMYERYHYHTMFQRAPTLGGECYCALRDADAHVRAGFNGHPPLGVNATDVLGSQDHLFYRNVSTGTHPWG